MDHALHIRTVESGYNSILKRPEGGAESPPGKERIQLSGRIKTDAPFRIDKGISQPGCKNTGIQIFSAAYDIILPRAFAKVLPELLDLLI